MITNQLIDTVKERISEVANEYARSPGMILSEDDLKCHIFSRLVPLFDHHMATSDDGIFASPLHTEIKFLDSSGQLCLRPDITILDPKNLTLKRSEGIDISRKGFVFCGSSLIIEIKFCKARSGINQKHLNTYRADCQKMIDIHQRLYAYERTTRMHGIFVAFNKTNKGINAFNNFRAQYDRNQNIDIIYATGDFKF